MGTSSLGCTEPVVADGAGRLLNTVMCAFVGGSRQRKPLHANTLTQKSPFECPGLWWVLPVTQAFRSPPDLHDPQLSLEPAEEIVSR